jgi:hypothetical protein
LNVLFLPVKLLGMLIWFSVPFMIYHHLWYVLLLLLRNTYKRKLD